MNSIILSGRLGSEIREYTTTNGKNVVHFSLAVRKSFNKDENGTIPLLIFKSKYGERQLNPAKSIWTGGLAVLQGTSMAIC